MSGIVSFDSAAFLARYPEFAAVSVPTLTAYFNEATLYLDNTAVSRVSDLTQRAMLLNMIVAHIAKLATKPGVVGRLNTATEGSVTAGFEFNAPANGTQAWFIQTQYGAQYWAATAKYRTMRYKPRPICLY